jgi:hypothetical protein
METRRQIWEYEGDPMAPDLGPDVTADANEVLLRRLRLPRDWTGLFEATLSQWPMLVAWVENGCWLPEDNEEVRSEGPNWFFAGPLVGRYHLAVLFEEGDERFQAPLRTWLDHWDGRYARATEPIAIRTVEVLGYSWMFEWYWADGRAPAWWETRKPRRMVGAFADDWKWSEEWLARQ